MVLEVLLERLGANGSLAVGLVIGVVFGFMDQAVPGLAPDAVRASTPV